MAGHNSFEQLLINYVNESLQSLFVRDLFRDEQSEYEREGLEWEQVSYADNGETLSMIEGRTGLIAMLDEETRFPKGTDASFLAKALANASPASSSSSSLSLSLSPLPAKGVTAFAVSHYAGTVVYDASGFLAKNRDALPDELLHLVSLSTSPLVRTLAAAAADPDSDPTTSLSLSPSPSPSSPSPSLSAPTLSRKKLSSLAGKFRRHLSSLLSLLSLSHSLYIRCLKPNDEKRAGEWERERVSEQLRLSGMLETVRVRKAGFGVRLSVDVFVARYRRLTASPSLSASPPSSSSLSLSETASLILSLLPPTEYAVGT
jgi:myosin heavy subunit